MDDTMGIFDLFGKRDVSGSLGKKMPYAIRTEFVPYKLKAKERSSSSFVVTIKNLTGEPVVSSLVIDVPKQLSLDSTGISKQKELRLGTLSPDESKETKTEVFGDVGTDSGEYTITLTAFIHYRDYAHVLNAMKKRVVIEAVERREQRE